ncbi:SURF1 family protein [Actinotalea subterranea]|uniref:SURF1 family protein n=1 Tax=Actinotalea subterranea TaxID=2607497 RepID=UPI0011EFB447|nr:SURF1 family protein [Actinotalea subterranea]
MTAADAGTPARPAYLRTATTPRMLVILVLLLGAAAVCARLGVWQLDRAELRGAAAARAEQQEAVDAEPTPLDDVLAPQSSFRGDLVGEKVLVRGAYEPDELLVAGRVLDGAEGYLVLTPLRVEAGTAAGAPVLAVVRGWVPTPEAAADLGPAPAGVVEVTGYLQGGEAGGTGDLPAGQVEAISPGELVNRWGGPTYSAYLVLAESDPAQAEGLALLGPPTAQGAGLNLQNLAYALQWWIFGGFAVLLWARLVRDEARAALEDDDEHAVPDDDANPAAAADVVAAVPGADDTADDTAGDVDAARVTSGRSAPAVDAAP